MPQGFAKMLLCFSTPPCDGPERVFSPVLARICEEGFANRTRFLNAEGDSGVALMAQVSIPWGHPLGKAG
jgi:hypothetical protein